MNIAMFGMVGVVVAASTVTSVSLINSGSGSNHVASYVELVEGGPPLDRLDDLMIALEFDGASSEDVLGYLADAAELELLVQQDLFGFYGNDKVSIHTPELQFNDAMRRLLGAIDRNDGLTWRVDGGILEVGTQELFDQREMLLATFDLSAAVEALMEEYGDPEGARKAILRLITDTIEPLGWEDNGGETGSLQLIGNQMFVKAPPRYLPGISWLLGQLERGGEPVEPVTEIPVGALEGGGGSDGGSDDPGDGR